MGLKWHQFGEPDLPRWQEEEEEEEGEGEEGEGGALILAKEAHPFLDTARAIGSEINAAYRHTWIILCRTKYHAEVAT